MFEWWEGLSSLLKVLYCIAFPASLLLLLQVVLSLFGLGHGDGDFNASDTSGLDPDAGTPGGSDAGTPGQLYGPGRRTWGHWGRPVSAALYLPGNRSLFYPVFLDRHCLCTISGSCGAFPADRVYGGGGGALGRG